MSIIYQDSTLKIASIQSNQQGDMFTVQSFPVSSDSSAPFTELTLSSGASSILDLVPGTTYALTVEEPADSTSGIVELASTKVQAIEHNELLVSLGGIAVPGTRLQTDAGELIIAYGLLRPSPWPDLFDMDANYRFVIG